MPFGKGFLVRSTGWRDLRSSGSALIYLLAFLAAVNQFRPLVGERGLLPVPEFLRYVNFRRAPSIFHFFYSDRFFGGVALAGIVLSIVALTSFSERGPLWISIAVWASLYLMYLSIMNVGQVFYGVGWESMLLEAGFLAIFLGTNRMAAPAPLIFLLRWMLFRWSSAPDSSSCGATLVGET